MRRFNFCNFIFLNLALFCIPLRSTAAPATSQASTAPTDNDQATPMAMLRASDALGDVGPEAYVRFYYAKDDSAKRLVTAETNFDAQYGLLMLIVDKKWGKGAEDAITHAIDGETVADMEAGKLTIEGDHATLVFKDDRANQPIKMVKADGRWKIDIDAIRQEIGITADDYVDGLHKMSAMVSDIADAIDRGQIKTAAQTAAEAKKRYEAMQ